MTSELAACAVVEYRPEFQVRAASELALLPDDPAIAEMLSDYAVMREQARVCRGGCPAPSLEPRHAT